MIRSLEELHRKASVFSSILEVGCGTGRNLRKIRSSFKVGIDAFMPVMLKERSLNHGINFLRFNILRGFPNLFKTPFECVLGIDIVEHFDKDTAISVISDCEKAASRSCLFFIPVGNHPQTKDDQGLGNDFFQTHRSTWYPQDMERLGYTVSYFPEFHACNKGTQKETGAMFCEKTL